MRAFILYLSAGLATGIPVVYLFGWTAWAGPVPIGFSILGSLLLIVGAYLSFVAPQMAARVALVGCLAVWSLYLPETISLAAKAVRVKLRSQQLEVRVIAWTPSNQPLIVSDSLGQDLRIPAARLSPADITQLRNTGINGRIENFHYSLYGKGKHSEVIIVIQQPVTVAAALPQPDATSVVYVQRGTDWIKHPADAPTLKRDIRIEPLQNDPNQNLLTVELADGSRQGVGISFGRLQSGDAK